MVTKVTPKKMENISQRPATDHMYLYRRFAQKQMSVMTM